MWESTGNGHYSQPNCPYRNPPLQPNVFDGFVHPEATEPTEPTELTETPFLQQSDTKNVFEA